MKVIHSNNRYFYFISTFFLLLLTFYVLGCSSIFSYTCGRDDTVSQILLPVQLYLTSLFLVGILTEHYHIIPLFITVILLLLVAYLLQNLYKKNGLLTTVLFYILISTFMYPAVILAERAFFSSKVIYENSNK